MGVGDGGRGWGWGMGVEDGGGGWRMGVGDGGWAWRMGEGAKNSTVRQIFKNCSFKIFHPKVKPLKNFSFEM